MLEEIEERTIELINTVNSMWTPDTFTQMKELEKTARAEFNTKQNDQKKTREFAETQKR